MFDESRFADSICKHDCLCRKSCFYMIVYVENFVVKPQNKNYNEFTYLIN